MPEPARSLTVAITGASGARYAVRLLERALPHFEPLYLTISRPAFQVMEQELGLKSAPEEFSPALLLPGHPQAKRICYCQPYDFGAPIASGSAAPDAMVIVPCSMGTVGRLAAGASDDLIHRAADVMLKERRRLILVPRETPLSLVHLRNLLAVTEAGAVVLPASPGFYHRPQTVEDLIDFVVSRILDHLGVRDPAAKRWGIAANEPE
ncbi:MAG: UbiX family flavin prenyltransferase [Armatimonadetes bacterium]|nr:UbiX family flavin prenyltransferase [Armatimonadota bacterium]